MASREESQKRRTPLRTASAFFMALVICATWSRTTASYCAQFAATARRARAPSSALRGAAPRSVLI